MGEEILDDAEGAEESAPEGSTELTADNSGEAEAKASEDTASEAASETANDTSKKPEDGDADKGIEGAPDSYTDFTLPEGMELDADALEEATPLFKEMNASQDTAQKVVDVASKMVEKVLHGQQTAWAETQSKWREAAETDEEFGKGNYNASIVIAQKAMREVGGPALAKALEETGTGNHPEFIRFFKRVGDAIGEDGMSFGGTAKSGEKSLAERMFPNQGQAA